LDAGDRGLPDQNMQINDREFVTVDQVRLEVRRWPGEGLPILLLHQALGSISMWREFPEQLAQTTQHEVIAWSRRGHGFSDRLPDRRDPDYLHGEAVSLPGLMDAVRLDRAHLFGHSDGSSIALIAAALHPDRVAGLILEAPHVYVEQLTVDSIAAVRASYETSGLRRKLGRHHADADRVFRQWTDIWFDPRFRDWNIENLLPEIRVPALLIQGRDDEYGTMDQLDRIAAVLPVSRHLVLADCGHSPHRDQRAAVLEASAAFLKDINS
jgi:pimeloyl-ACP methyl ester carboxylesterase